MRAVADWFDEAMLCFDLLQQELGLPAGAEPRYARLLDGGGDGEQARR
jgi:hypothetical protein